MRHALKYLVLLIFVVYCFHLEAQTYFFDNYNVRDGLAQSNVYDVIQDERGYIWLGTASGASRFDGAGFINYSKDEGIAENGVRTIIQDPKGNIWMGHIGGGLTRINPKGKIQHITPAQNKQGADITDFVIINKDQLWMSTHGEGLFMAENIYSDSLSELSFKQYKGKEGLSDRVFSIYQNENDTIFLVTDVGIKTYNPNDESFSFFKLEGIPHFFTITCMLQDHLGDYWFGTYNGGLFRYKSDKKEFLLYDKTDGLEHNWISTLYQDSENNLWIGTWGGGLSRYKNEKIKNFNKENGLQDNKIRCITEDREGNILIGTNENGLSIFKGEYIVTFTEEDGLVNNHVWAIETDKYERFWFGTNNGITIYDPSEKSYKYIKEETDLPSHQIRYIENDKDHNIWIGMWDGGGLVKVSPSSEEFNYPYRINQYIAQLSRGNVTALEVDQKNNLWIGTFDGILYYNINTGGLTRLTNRDGLAGNDITSVYADRQNNLWIGSRNKGITKVEDTVFTQLMDTISITPTCFTMQQNGDIWVGTESKGVFVLNKAQKLANHWSKANGLLSNYISALETDEHDNVYIGTNNGINKYIQDENTFQVYTAKSGVIGIEVKHNSICKDTQGRLWFGTVEGATRINPALEPIEHVKPLTHIENFQVNFNHRKMTQELKLNYTENSIIFDFNSIYLTDPQALRYKFKLEGSDPAWRYSDKGMSVTYNSLPPGNYTFKVKAKNSRGYWNEQPASFSFRIKPPFWQTWWFILFTGIVIIVAIYAYIRLRERKLRREKAILEQRVKQRTKKIREQNQILESKNKAIYDSINYARRIQTAIMHDKSQLLKFHPDSMMLYKPKDIVSGDFYWFSMQDNKLIFVAADCTGHGVPGAFMSLIGISTLNQIINEMKVLQPAQILNNMREYIISELQQTGKTEESKDGMDIALCIVDKQTHQAEFAGAYNSLYIVRQENVSEMEETKNKKTFKDSLIEIKGDRMPIGISEKVGMPFQNHSLQLKPGDELFLTTDGYIDQFGGPKNKKLMARRFKEILLKAYEYPIDRQSEFLDRQFAEWRGENEQIDDVLIIATQW